MYMYVYVCVCMHVRMRMVACGVWYVSHGVYVRACFVLCARACMRVMCAISTDLPNSRNMPCERLLTGGMFSESAQRHQGGQPDLFSDQPLPPCLSSHL
jgi:hypothetical protein